MQQLSSLRQAGPGHVALRYVAAGGAAGALTRWAVAGLAGDRETLAVFAMNVAGSIVLGLLVGASRTRSGRRLVTGNQFLLLGAGFCGALTTFCTFALDVAKALDEGAVLSATLTGFGTATMTVLGAGIGYRIGSRP